MNSRAERRRASKGKSAAETESAVPPRLFFDFFIAASLLCYIAWLAKESLNPDGVAYLELAEAVVRGDWGRFVQGYWSPGFPLLLAPITAVFQEYRWAQLHAVHVLQAIVGVGALALSVVAVRRRIPCALQRAAFWVCAWTIVRLISQEFVTPDLLLATCIIAAIGLLDQPSPRAQIEIGLLAGAAYLFKTSSWPWLGFAALLAAWPALKQRASHRVPWRVFVPAALVIGGWLIAMGVKEGRPTLGSVGPLNFGWYLGDLERRIPDTFNGNHTMDAYAILSPEKRLKFVDLRSASETYLPWSAPEYWARIFPSSSPRFSISQALNTWRYNISWTALNVFPAVIGIACLALLFRRRGERGRSNARPEKYTLLATGAFAFVTFVAIHVEHRLLAPAILMIAFGTVAESHQSNQSARLSMRIASLAFVILLLADTFYFVESKYYSLPAAEATLHARRTKLEASESLLTPRGVVVIGPAMPWLQLLWLERLKVAAQFTGGELNTLVELPDEKRINWLRQTFSQNARAYAAEVSVADSTQGIVTYSRLETW